MDFEALFKALPDIIKLFVPGFVCLKTYNSFVDTKSDSFESTAVSSIAVSYIISLVTQLIGMWVQMSDVVENLLAVILAFACAVIVVKAKMSAKFKEVMRFIGGISGNESIWQDIFDRNKGSWIRCYAKYYHKDVIIEGKVKYYEPCEDGECSIALIDYVVKYEDGNVYKLGKRDDEPIMYINTKNIHGLEVTRGK